MIWPAPAFGATALALIIERFTGYPDKIYRRIGHPIEWIGWWIGWLEGKLNDPTHTTPKYLFGRAVQDLGYLNNPASTNLQAVCDRLKEQGLTATVSGDDKIDFGEGPVDVIFAVGDPGAHWQWCPLQ